MVSSFRELHAFDKEIYVKVKPAVTTIEADSKEAIKLACDQGAWAKGHGMTWLS